MFQIDVTCDFENTQTPCSKELKLHDFMRANVMYAVCTEHEAHPTIIELQKQCLQSNAVAVPAYAIFPSSVFLDTDVIIRFVVYKRNRDTFSKIVAPYEKAQIALLPYSPEIPTPSEDHARVVAMLKTQAEKCAAKGYNLCFRTNGATPGEGSCSPSQITTKTDEQIIMWLASWGIKPQFMKTETDLFWKIF